MRNIVERKYKIAGIIMLPIYIMLSAFIGKAIVKDYRLMLVLWLIGIFIYIKYVPKINSRGRLSQIDKINFEALIFAVAYCSARYLIGVLIFNLGKSPYSLTPSGILYNMSNVIPQLIAKELVRFHLINTYCSRRKNEPVFYGVSFILAVCDLNWNLIKATEDFKGLSQILAKELLPDLCESVLLSFLAAYGSALTSIIYVMISIAFEYLMPVMPDLNWFSEGVLGTLIPVIMISYITTKYNTKRHREKVISIKEQVETGLVLAFSVLLIWFVVGVFPIYPSVIATGSMEPLIYPGDIILIRQIRDMDEIYSLEVGDVIQFSRDNILITHRIIGIEQDSNGKTAFLTKGDNNSAQDSRPVYPEDIKGTLVQVIPKLGYPTLLIKERKNVQLSEIEF